MKTSIFLAAIVCSTALVAPVAAQEGPESVQEGGEPFSQSVLVEGLEGPWELTWGPDDWLWVTERTGKRITRVNPDDGTTEAAVTIDEVAAPGGQDGLLGMDFHPAFGDGSGNDYVYVGYTYLDEDYTDEAVTDPDSPYVHLRAKIVRLTWDAETETLGEPMELIAGLPASNDHNSGRLKIGPDEKLYYTIGDQGNNQLANVCVPIEAQRLPTQAEIEASDYEAYVGKSLRLDLDGAIPEDNPEIEGVRSHVYTYGHRNMQGIDFGPDGTLYASEHGPKSDDEINILLPGGNYGWPHLAGFQDDMAYVYAQWSESSDPPCEDLEFSDLEIPQSVPTTPESDWEVPENYQPPIVTMFTVPDDYEFSDPVCEGIDFICWPTIAPSSLEYYGPEEGEPIPGWERSLLVPTLKRGSLYRIALSENGTQVEGSFHRYFQSENRFRDTAVAPDGQTIYVATDPGGLAEATGGGTTTEMENPGAIMVFTHGESDREDAASQGAAPAEETDVVEDSAAQDSGGEPTGERMLPQFTSEQAANGRNSYNANCAACHGSNLTNGTMGTPLAGSYFANQWGGRSLADLYTYAHENMPPSAPGSLDDQAYANIVAYILSVNGFEPGDAELPADPVQMENQYIHLEDD